MSPLLLALIPFFLGAVQQAPISSSPDSETEVRAILVTGASSGIGRKTAELLATNGFYVYAGARKPKDLAALDAIENVQGVRLDVTVAEDIDAAVETIREAGRGLYGLVNNAGVVVIAPLIECTEDDMAFQMDVNVFGPYRVTKAFAPMIIESRGRITTTGSISGFVTWGFGGPYTMSKHAVEAYSDVLAAEMAPFGVQVSVVEPGNYRSRIMTNMRQRLKDNGYTTEDSLYRDQLDRLLGSPHERAQYKEPDEVAAAILQFFTEEQPKRRYMVVPNAREAEITIRATLQRVAELNQAQAYRFERDELVRMLDEALSRTSQSDK